MIEKRNTGVNGSMNILVINAGSSSLKYQLMNPDTGDVTDILLNTLQRHGNIFPADLPKDAVVGLHPGLDALNGITVIFEGILLIQYFKFRLHLHDGTLIIRHQLVHGALILLDQIQKLV